MGDFIFLLWSIVPTKPKWKQLPTLFPPTIAPMQRLPAKVLLSLLAIGEEPESESVQAAAEWLEQHSLLERAEGIPLDDPDQWHTVLIFYHYWVRAEVYDRLDWPGGWKSELHGLLADEQQQDGSFSNPLGARK